MQQLAAVILVYYRVVGPKTEVPVKNRSANHWFLFDIPVAIVVSLVLSYLKLQKRPDSETYATGCERASKVYILIFGHFVIFSQFHRAVYFPNVRSRTYVV